MHKYRIVKEKNGFTRQNYTAPGRDNMGGHRETGGDGSDHSLRSLRMTSTKDGVVGWLRDTFFRNTVAFLGKGPIMKENGRGCR